MSDDDDNLNKGKGQIDRAYELKQLAEGHKSSRPNGSSSPPLKNSCTLSNCSLVKRQAKMARSWQDPACVWNDLPVPGTNSEEP
eukprot:790637-Pelagomonas_calceolata.AAC.4